MEWSAVVWSEALRPEGHAVTQPDDHTDSYSRRAPAWPALPKRRFDHGTPAVLTQDLTRSSVRLVARRLSSSAGA